MEDERRDLWGLLQMLAGTQKHCLYYNVRKFFGQQWNAKRLNKALSIEQ